MDFNLARQNMIEQQIRPWDVLDQQTLDLFHTIHREDFVPEQFRRLALADLNIPLAHGEVTMTPKVEARLLQSLAVSRKDKALEIGTGCAFLTSLLACAAREVHSVDIYPEFTGTAATKLSRYGLTNVVLHTGDAARGWAPDQPYDVIAVTGSVPVLTGEFQRHLNINGRLFVIVGQPPVMEALLITRLSENEWSRESLFETDLPPLIGAAAPPRFSF
jgi:protein-L-isoaspartate(D-aspartate) O-methyltransferase